MEVHHHSHTERKKWTEYFWEFLMLFLAVTLGFYAENLREGIVHKEQVKTNMQSLLSDLESDVTLFDSAIERNVYSSTMADSMIGLLHNNISNTTEIYFTARAVTANFGNCYPNSKTFDQMKSSGILRFVHPHSLLDSIGNYYTTFEWLADQMELLRLKIDAIHKGNSALFDSYTFYRMMNSGHTYTSGFNGRINMIDHPETRPVLLTTDPKSINDISLNYHYYSSTVKFYNSTAKTLQHRAIILIDLIKKEYHLE